MCWPGMLSREEPTPDMRMPGMPGATWQMDGSPVGSATPPADSASAPSYNWTMAVSPSISVISPSNWMFRPPTSRGKHTIS